MPCVECVCAIDCKCVSEYDGNVTIPLVTLSSELNCVDRMCMLCRAVLSCPCFHLTFNSSNSNSSKMRERKRSNEISPKFRVLIYRTYITEQWIVWVLFCYSYRKINTTQIHALTNWQIHTQIHVQYMLTYVWVYIYIQQSNKRLCSPYNFFCRSKNVRSMHVFWLQGVHMYSCVPLNCLLYQTRSFFICLVYFR